MTSFNEVICICDDQTWIWNFITRNLSLLKISHVRLSSSVIIRKSWNRFKDAPLIVIYWENSERSSGAILEEILEVDPLFDMASKVIVVTTNPRHEDVVYFSELSVKQVIRPQFSAKKIKEAGGDLQNMVKGNARQTKWDRDWHRTLRMLAHCSPKTPPGQLDKLRKSIEAIHARSQQKESAVYFDAMAQIHSLKDENEQAVGLWQKAIDSNPNYYRTYNNLIEHFQRTNQYQMALDLIKKMQSLNKNSVSRSVQIGQIHAMASQDDKAEHYFQLALQKDKYCSTALNGLAEIRFRQENLEEARALLARSTIAYKTAQYLNKIGIDLVKAGSFKEALIHYSKAQFVLPQQSKGPMLFYNIGLCYHKWNKPKMALEFLKIALIKEPNYKKAASLVASIHAKKSLGAA
ncbi:MAG: tetratricopeptide repeat protein [Oligoflexales bacterium]